MLPISMSHPVAWQNPEVMRVSAALPANGAWDATPTELNVFGATSVILSFSYTEGAVGGAFDFQIQPSIYSVAANVPDGAGEWMDESLYASGIVAAGADTTSLVQAEIQSFNSVGVAIETFIYGPILLEATERIRIPARESGVTGTPGILQITAEFI